MTANTLQIGIFADNLRLPLREGIAKTAELGLSSFQMYTTSGEAFVSGEVTPDTMSAAQRREFCRFYEGLGLTLSATCAESFNTGFVIPERNEVMIPRMYAQIDLAVDLGASIVTTHIGTIPAEHNAVWHILLDAMNRVGCYAERHGVVLAAETGHSSGPVTREFIDSLDTLGIRINFDPANLVMLGFDLDEALTALMPYIVHTHAKDGVRNGGQYHETPLGQGEVPWSHYIACLKAGAYDGAYTIEREVGADPLADIIAAIDFLRQF